MQVFSPSEKINITSCCGRLNSECCCAVRYEPLYIQVKRLNPEIGVERLGVDLQPVLVPGWQAK